MLKKPGWTALVVRFAFLVLALTACSSPAASTGGAASAAKPTAGAASAAKPTAGAAPASKPASGPSSAASAADKLLTVSDVENVTGLTGIKLVPRNPSTGAGGDLNFALPDGSMVLMVNFMSAGMYDESKKQKGAVKEQVSGIGDDAFSGPADDNPYAIKPSPNEHAFQSEFAFRKGSQAVEMATYLNMNKPVPPTMYLSQDQLRDLAKMMISKM